MSDSCDQGDGGAEPSERRTPRKRRVPEQDPPRPVIIYTDSPQTIHVEVHNFKEVVQSLTGKEWSEDDLIQDPLAAHLSTGQQSSSSQKSREASESSTTPLQSSSTSSYHALEEYFDRLERENPSPPPSTNLGLFPTAGLVKGVGHELGLQWTTVPESIDSCSSRPSEPSSLVEK